MLQRLADILWVAGVVLMMAWWVLFVYVLPVLLWLMSLMQIGGE